MCTGNGRPDRARTAHPLAPPPALTTPLDTEATAPASGAGSWRPEPTAHRALHPMGAAATPARAGPSNPIAAPDPDARAGGSSWRRHTRVSALSHDVTAFSAPTGGEGRLDGYLEPRGDHRPVARAGWGWGVPMTRRRGRAPPLIIIGRR